MPYPKKQETAIFLDIKRRQGMAAAKAFARKHSEGAPPPKNARPYTGRRSK